MLERYWSVVRSNEQKVGWLELVTGYPLDCYEQQKQSINPVWKRGQTLVWLGLEQGEKYL